MYKARVLNQQLDLATRNFILDSAQISGDGERLMISSIFKWYWQDFGGQAGVDQLLLRTIPNDDPRHGMLVRAKRKAFGFLPYQWELNL